MGNCVFKGFGEFDDEAVKVKVVTSSGGIMELYAPITASSITDEFPGHAIFRSRDLFSDPLLHNEELNPGELYYLLPLNPYNYKTTSTSTANSKTTQSVENDGGGSGSAVTTPYRMSSCEGQGGMMMTMMMKKGKAAGDHHHHHAEVVPRYNSSGVWKVKLVISPEQLSEILSQEARTEALIESVRTVAKCGNGGGASSVASSDQWSVSSSWKGS
ncbi:UvrABC system protein C [Parasponia andersonii]|uniref:UvrABC system protein C n=1 Tax=Parasponia andersonii TaxID=3476 RepID=A0A2P5DQF7_PARAD|nr:UvrABC system protein C [Parasponia andersonii]